ncbi:DUF445 domain-containing protein [Bacillus sp. FJAT-27251]|uniref:DUF445 domain-containing protein n=1 Tax=Bacillus sp. FJAT-27251 TaxID=1684142 RepID=UPI000AC75184|nr:DUF445 domain-containing protein [Bacillus sp. FJAT-27251]
MKKEKKSRYLAGISLAVMAAGFLLTIPFQEHLWGRLLQGGFEAGLVGGLADWFAVTALFRHPLGLPIPHTALLPRNREKLTKSLIRMLEEEWLTMASILDKIKQIRITDKLFGIIRRELQTEQVKKAIHRLLLETVERVDLQKLAPFIEKELKGYLSSVRADRILKAAAAGILSRRYEEAAFDYVLQETGKWAATREAKQTMGRLGKQLIETTEADGLLRFAIQSFSSLVNEDKMGQIMQTFILNRIRNVSQPDNRYRALILDWIRKELSGLENREQLMEEINGWKNKLVEELELNEQISGLLEQAKERILQMFREEGFVESQIVPVIIRFLDEIESDAEKTAKIEAWIHKQTAGAIEKNHSKIGMLVKENLDKLDTKTLIAMLENNVGKDLQWIRVNGALCGFIIGVFLTVFKLAVY